MDTTICTTCQQAFELDEWRQGEIAKGRAVQCSACFNADLHERQAAIEAERRAERALEWKRICPDAYQQCQVEKLPDDASRAARAEAFEWRMEHGGLGIIGRASGQGKSKIICAVARRYYIAGVGVEFHTASDFALECSGKYDNQVLEWLAPIRECSLLILDDLGKEKISDRVAATIFNLVEYRTSRGKPILFTGNFNGAELSGQLGEQHGPYIVRRLREFCRIINL